MDPSLRLWTELFEVQIVAGTTILIQSDSATLPPKLSRGCDVRHPAGKEPRRDVMPRTNMQREP
jgi:hypothetical protein